jgi:hypothetical protein
MLREVPKVRSLVGFTSSLVVFAGVLCTHATAFAQAPAAGTPSVEEGRTRFIRGIDLYKEGNFRAALAEFRAADGAAPNWKIAYNLGQTLFQLQEYAGAVSAFERYLTEGADKVPPERRKEVEADLAKLRPRVAQVTVTVNVPSAEVLVDDESQGNLPRATPLLLSAGRRKITVNAHDYLSETRVIDLAGATSPTVPFELKPIRVTTTVTPTAPSTPKETPRPLPPPPPPPSRTPLWIGIGATVALGGATTFFGLRTASKNSDFDAVLNTPGATRKSVDDARNSVRSSALVTDVLGGATLVAAGLTVYALFATAPKTEQEAVKPGVTAFVGPASLGLSGRF